MIGVLETCECGREFLRGIYPQQKCEICDVKTFNEIWCGGLNKDNNDPPRKVGKKTGWLYREHPYFFSHICEAIIIFKECFKKK